jgi:hypothetical protein
MTETQTISNKEKSVVRARVEHIFGFMHNRLPSRTGKTLNSAADGWLVSANGLPPAVGVVQNCVG